MNRVEAAGIEWNGDVMTGKSLVLKSVGFFLCTFFLCAAGAAAQGTPAGLILPDSLKEVDIREGFVPAPGFQEGGEDRRPGRERGRDPSGDRSGLFREPGDSIFENDALETLAGSRCRLRFRNEDVVTMAANSRFGVDEYRDGGKDETSRSFMSVLKGKAMFYALRLFGRTKRDVRVTTPTAVAGVRGTKFGVHVYWVEETAKARTGNRVAALDAEMGFAQTQGPGRSFTDCFSEDGVVDVNGRAVTPGNMFRGRDGAVVPTPPDYVRAFESATEVRGGEGEGGGTAGQGDETGGEETSGAGEDGGEEGDEEGEGPVAGGDEGNGFRGLRGRGRGGDRYHASGDGGGKREPAKQRVRTFPTARQPAGFTESPLSC